MTPATTVKLALTGGRSDHLRIGLTMAASTLGTVLGLAAINVLLIGGSEQGRYRSAVLDQSGLHAGVLAAILGLLVPLVLFVGQCSRLGAPARDRRLAAFRMAGATPAEVRLIAAAETGLATIGGGVLGAASFVAAKALLPSTPDFEGRLAYPTDVAVPAWVFVVVVGALAVVSTLGAMLALRNVSIDPLGVARQKRRTVPTLTPLLLLGIGVLGLSFSLTLFTALGLDKEGNPAPMAISFLFFVCVAIGLTLGSAALTQRIAGVIAPRTRRVALLLASRRMIDAPYRASRPTAAVLLAVFVAATIQQTRTNFLLATDPADPFYAGTFDLLDLVLIVAVLLAAAGLIVAAAEGISERRRTLASLVAGGTPRATIARSVLGESLVPLLPGVLVAATAGTLVARGFFGGRVSHHSGEFGNDPSKLVAVPIPWDQLGLLIGGSLFAVTALTAVALLFLPASTSTVELRAAA